MKKYIYTPGPWEVSGHKKNGILTHCQIIKRKYHGHGTVGVIANVVTSPETNEANANLIAAAPDLYSALNYTLGILESIEGTDIMEQIADFLDEDIDLVLIENALKKAKGEK